MKRLWIVAACVAATAGFAVRGNAQGTTSKTFVVNGRTYTVTWETTSGTAGTGSSIPAKWLGGYMTSSINGVNFRYAGGNTPYSNIVGLDTPTGTSTGLAGPNDVTRYLDISGHIEQACCAVRPSAAATLCYRVSTTTPKSSQYRVSVTFAIQGNYKLSATCQSGQSARMLATIESYLTPLEASYSLVGNSISAQSNMYPAMIPAGNTTASTTLSNGTAQLPVKFPPEISTNSSFVQVALDSCYFNSLYTATGDGRVHIEITPISLTEQ